MSKIEAVVTGIGETDLGVVEGVTEVGLCVDAATQALDDAGIALSEVDGLLCMPPFGTRTPRYHMIVGESLGLFTKTLCDSLSMGGAAPCGALQTAQWAVESGLCKNVLVVTGERLRTGHSVAGGGTEVMASVGAHSLDYEYPYGAHIPAFYGLLAQRYLHEYGKDASVLAPIAVAMRKHAALNPKAEKRTPITVDDVMASPLISSPLRRLDCSLVSDGGAAYLVSARGTSKDPRREIEILGLGQGHSSYHMGHLARGDESHDLVRTVADVAGARAFAQAGLRPDDIDVAQIYDSFTITAMVQLEDLGFCGRGEGADFVANGNIELGGTLPMNTHGGLLSCAHPGHPGGMLHINEAVRQLRGEADGRQVADARTSLVTSASAVSSNYSVAILGSAA